MTDHEKKLTSLKEDLEKAKSLKYRAEAKLEQLTQQKEELTKELNKLGVKPDEVDDKIKKLDNEITELFKEANKLLPRDILNRK
ncbi:hypothetical protein [Dethiothermospora halolimnae]|uniref:hypothetical protein n=1 Tax=Dethiothermospora halolimnae TaxID=3114390 RepID=UPI003CCBE0DB